MPYKINIKVWSTAYLDTQVKTLKRLHDHIDPKNLFKLIKAIDELERMLKDFIEVMENSGNDDSDIYELTLHLEGHQAGVRSLLEEMVDNEWQLDVATAQLQTIMLELRKLIVKNRKVAFQFSEN